ncbi:MAG: DNA-3-methyladenine glycosylase [Fimbriimonadaceae bacterium]|nr:DNA-3-methyladenine glycosylase [Fimbriimonadaceae bacterium]
MSLLPLLTQDVLAAAPSLLGWHLVRDGLRARIVEVEAYRASDDPACHAFLRTAMKNMAMFGPPGKAYVYFTYGCHWMLNVVAHGQGDAAAILIRAAEPIQGSELFRERRPKARRDRDLLSGPGKLAAAFAIDASDNGVDLLDLQSKPGLLRLESPDIPAPRIVAGTRIGIALGKGHDYPWRFADADRLVWVSRPLTF